ncbi:MAG: ABC transporter permease, partial [bacterium]
MFKNDLKIAIRHLIKNKTYTLINIGGLCLGVTSALAIFLILTFELSFDTFHENAGRIFRVVRAENVFGKINYTPATPYPLPRALKLDFPEIEAVSILDRNFDASVIAIEREKGDIFRYREKSGVAFVDPEYFQIFTYQWLQGSPQTALQAPKSVVLSESLARKYFGQENVVGKTLTFNNHLDLHVTGIVKDVPENTDIPFNMLIAFHSEKRGDDHWGNTYGSVNCFLKLAEGVDPKKLESRLGEFHAKYREKEKAREVALMLQPLTRLHFDTRFKTFNRTIAPETLWSLALIGTALVLIACINFINLNTALAVHRAKEVGLRKVLGSTKPKIVRQLLGETAVITGAAILASLAFVEIVVRHLHVLLDLPRDFFEATDSAIIVFLLILFFFVTAGAGLFPALYLSRFTPVQALRRYAAKRFGAGISLRKGLVMLQFAISQALVLSAIVISTQTRYLRNVDMGFDREAVVEVRLPANDGAKLARFKTQLLQEPGIRNVSFSNTGTASMDDWGGDFVLKDSEQVQEGHAQIKFVDEDFLATYRVSLLAGEAFEPVDSIRKFLVNEAFVREAGYGQNEQAILGKYVSIWTREAPIVGIVKDFHTESLHQKIEPVIMLVENIYRQAGIKIALRDIPHELETIEQAWSSVYPEHVFDYAFLDDTIAQFYENEQRTARVIGIFTIIAIVIGCMGLFGLISYMATQRTKEIGIRKVLGATVANVTALLSKDFVKLVLLANLIAWPAAWYAMNKWLQ